MRKKISLLLCVLAAMLCFTACGSSKEAVEYDEASMEQVTEFLIEYCSNADDAMMEQWSDMSEFNMNLQLTQAGLPIEPGSFISTMDAWKAAVKECGDYVSHGDYTYEASGKEVKVSTEAEFKDRDATITFVFDDRLYLDSMTVDAEYTTGEILEKAGLNTVLGMGTVFVVLIFISLVISLFRFIPAIENAFKRKPAAEMKKESVPAKEPAAKEAQVSETDDTELIAVISAAIAAAEGTSTDGFIVRSIRRRPSNKWNS